MLALAGLLMTSASAKGADVTTIPRQHPFDDTVTIVSTICRSFASVSRRA